MPYLPLYVQDFLTDEKLIECSAEATGVYIRLLCIMHKSQEYGKILLRQKDRQTDQQIFNFAAKIAKSMPYEVSVISRSLEELVNEGVLTIEGNVLYQKRMVKDGELSDKRALSGRKGAESTNGRSQRGTQFAAAKPSAKLSANSENENDIDNEIEIEDKEAGKGDTEEGDRARGSKPDPMHNPDLGRVMDYYLDKIDPTPSTTCTTDLIYFTERFGADIVIHAIDAARDALKNRANWNYIRGILRSYSRANVQTLGDVLSMEEAFDAEMDRKKAGGKKAKSFADMWREEPDE